MQCEIHDDSLKFSRAVYGLMVLIAIIIHNPGLVLAAAILVFLGIFSFKLNIAYQFHLFFIKKRMKNAKLPVKKETGELVFVAAMTAVLLFIGFLWLHYGHNADAAWIYVLMVDLLIFLACFVGFCVATLMYILLKKLFTSKKSVNTNISSN